MDVGRLKTNHNTWQIKSFSWLRLDRYYDCIVRGKASERSASYHQSHAILLKKYILQFVEAKLSIDAINDMSDHELELLFGSTEEPPKDKRFEELQIITARV